MYKNHFSVTWCAQGLFEVFIFKKSKFSHFSEENWYKIQVLDFKMCLSVFYMLVLISSFEQKFQNIKSIHFQINQKHFCEAYKSWKNRQNFLDAVHSHGHSHQADNPKRVLGLVFLLPGNPNAPQQVNFQILDLAHNNQHSIQQ